MLVDLVEFSFLKTDLREGDGPGWAKQGRLRFPESTLFELSMTD